ncbi:MAG: PHP domain-containing protein, partial [Dehalococcoidia bacterium]|nr:PHP domain-containing protein [Dehalococcoidia bacterium]
MLIDIHSHTWPRSHDSVLNPDDLIVRAKAAGLDAIVFTEHDTVW